MTVREVADIMDGWTNLRVDKYEDVSPYGRYTPLYDSSREEWVDVPEDLADLEVTGIRVENNSIVLEVED